MLCNLNQRNARCQAGGVGVFIFSALTLWKQSQEVTVPLSSLRRFPTDPVHLNFVLGKESSYMKCVCGACCLGSAGNFLFIDLFLI